jgi:hypothetical protein
MRFLGSAVQDRAGIETPKGCTVVFADGDPDRVSIGDCNTPVPAIVVQVNVPVVADGNSRHHAVIVERTTLPKRQYGGFVEVDGLGQIVTVDVEIADEALILGRPVRIKDPDPVGKQKRGRYLGMAPRPLPVLARVESLSFADETSNVR